MSILKQTALSLALIGSSALMPATGFAAETQTELWRLDCGRIEVNLLNAMSDSFAYPDQKMTLTNSCYLIRQGEDYPLWDAGLPAAMLNAPVDANAPLSPTLERDLVSQLAEIGVEPNQIGRIGISHYHFDHTGQAATFANATLLIGAEDLAALQQDTPPAFADPRTLTPWLAGDGETTAVSGDEDAPLADFCSPLHHRGDGQVGGFLASDIFQEFHDVS